MGSLNDIPDYLKSDAPEREWTPKIGMRRGIRWTTCAFVLLGGVWATIGYLAPMIALYPWISWVVPVVLSSIIFGVMQNSSGQVRPKGNAIALGFAIALWLVGIGGGLLGLYSTMNANESVYDAMLKHELWAGIALPLLTTFGAAWLARDGSNALGTMFEIFSIR